MAGEALPVREIWIDEDDLQEIKRNAWSKLFKPARLKVEDSEEEEAEFGLRGGHTRNYLKKSFEVRTRSGKTLHWNAEFDDPSMMRNALSFHFFNQIGLHAPRTNHCWLFINGVPQGVYLEIEAVDDRFFVARSIPYKGLLYAVNDSANFSLIDPITKKKKESLFEGYELRRGVNGTKQRLIQFVRTIHLKRGTTQRTATAKRLDIPQYLHWLAGAVLTGNYDGFDQNYALYEYRVNGKYRIIPWDYEGTWGRNCYGKPCEIDLVRLQGYNALTKHLFRYESSRKKYRAIMNKLLHTSFTEEQLGPIIDEMHGRLVPAIRYDYTRQYSYDTFLEERDFIKQYVKERRAHLLNALRKWKD